MWQKYVNTAFNVFEFLNDYNNRIWIKTIYMKTILAFPHKERLPLWVNKSNR